MTPQVDEKRKAELESKGFAFERAGVCKGPNCGRAVEWWKTPRGKMTPMDPGTLVSHFQTCPDAASFRRGGGRP